MYVHYVQYSNINSITFFTYHSCCHISEAFQKQVRWIKLSGDGMHYTLEK